MEIVGVFNIYFGRKKEKFEKYKNVLAQL